MSNPPTIETKPATPGAPLSIEKLKVKVDGKEFEVPKTTPDPLTGKPIATTMIQACALAAVDVPHYCYHPKLAVAGNCRMCLVEFGTPAMGPDRKPVLNPDGTPRIAKSPRPAIACATPVSPGMEIYTNTPGVKQMREGVLESLLINHPLDCPICDQAGECKLQEYSVDYGQSQSRFVEAEGAQAQARRPRPAHRARRRALHSVHALHPLHQGQSPAMTPSASSIAAATTPSPPSRASPSTTTTRSTRWTSVPVGALTSKDFRFKMRVWFLKETKSICTSCGHRLQHRHRFARREVYRYEPRENDAVNSHVDVRLRPAQYKWIAMRKRQHREYALAGTRARGTQGVREISEKLQRAPVGSVRSSRRRGQTERRAVSC
jgi:NADH-quinone oxidoreductase subunit G